MIGSFLIIRILYNANIIIFIIMAFFVTVSASPVKDSTESEPKRNIYTLFHPVPNNSLRELNADRPDKTDCPFTVDAGHFQVEMDLVNMTYNPPDEKRNYVGFRSTEVAPMNLKIGLLRNLDFQLVFTSYKLNKTNDQNNNITSTESGFYGITPRLKINVMGNDSGFFALALIPFISIPVDKNSFNNNALEGGLGVPFAFDIPGWDIGFQTSVYINRNDAGNKYHLEYENSVSIGHPIFGRLSLSGEFFTSISTEAKKNWIGTLDTWLTFQVNENFRTDGGVYLGVTSAADQWHPWVGFTWRY